MVNWDNYEEYLILQADGELTEVEERHLLEFIDKHPELRGELLAFESLKLVPDENVRFPDKASLLKPVAAPRTITFGWRWMLAAAAVLALFSTTVFSLLQENTPDSITVLTGTESVPPQSVEEGQPAQQGAIIAALPVAGTRQEASLAAPSSAKQNIRAVPERDRLKALPAPEPFPLEEQVPGPVLVAEAIAYDPVPDFENETLQEEQKVFLSWLPVKEEKRAGLQRMAEGLGEQLTRAKGLGSRLGESQLDVRLGNKEMTLNF